MGFPADRPAEPPSRGGFSLIEGVVVLAILASMATFALPLAEIVRFRTQERQLRERLGEIRSAIDAYRNSLHPSPVLAPVKYPPSIASLMEPIPNAIVRQSANPGPFLASGSLLNPFTLPVEVYHWDVRDGSGTWHLDQRDPATIYGTNGEKRVYDIRYPTNGCDGLKRSPLDGSTYDKW